VRDAESREHLKARLLHARALHRRLGLLLDLVAEGLTDGQISERFGQGWSVVTVARYRLFLGAAKREQGRRGEGKGRWRESRP